MKIPPLGKLAAMVQIEPKPLGYDLVLQVRGVNIETPADDLVATVLMLAYAASVLEGRGYDAVEIVTDMRNQDVLGYLEESDE